MFYKKNVKYSILQAVSSTAQTTTLFWQNLHQIYIFLNNSLIGPTFAKNIFFNF